MAQVDFSNATIEPNPLNGERPMDYTYFKFLQLNNIRVEDSSGNMIASGVNNSRESETVSAFSVKFIGTFTDSGTEFYLGDKNGNTRYIPWKISGITFSSGDTFEFIVDIDFAQV